MLFQVVRRTTTTSRLRCTARSSVVLLRCIYLCSWSGVVYFVVCWVLSVSGSGWARLRDDISHSFTASTKSLMIRTKSLSLNRHRRSFRGVPDQFRCKNWISKWESLLFWLFHDIFHGMHVDVSLICGTTWTLKHNLLWTFDRTDYIIFNTWLRGWRAHYFSVAVLSGVPAFCLLDIYMYIACHSSSRGARQQWCKVFLCLREDSLYFFFALIVLSCHISPGGSTALSSFVFCYEYYSCIVLFCLFIRLSALFTFTFDLN